MHKRIIAALGMAGFIMLSYVKVNYAMDYEATEAIADVVLQNAEETAEAKIIQNDKTVVMSSQDGNTVETKQQMELPAEEETEILTETVTEKETEIATEPELSEIPEEEETKNLKAGKELQFLNSKPAESEIKKAVSIISEAARQSEEASYTETEAESAEASEPAPERVTEPERITEPATEHITEPVTEKSAGYSDGAKAVSAVSQNNTAYLENIVMSEYNEQAAVSNRVINISAADYDVLARIVEAEATGQNVLAKMLVANVVFNRINNPAFPNTVQDVVFQKNEVRSQFSPLDDGRYYTVTITDSTIEAVNRVLAGEDYSMGALYFATVKLVDTTGCWASRQCEELYRYGGHVFFKD